MDADEYEPDFTTEDIVREKLELEHERHELWLYREATDDASFDPVYVQLLQNEIDAQEHLISIMEQMLAVYQRIKNKQHSLS